MLGMFRKKPKILEIKIDVPPVDPIEEAIRKNNIFFDYEHHRFLSNFKWEAFVIAIDHYDNYEISLVIATFQKGIGPLKEIIETEKKRPEKISELLSVRSEYQALQAQLIALKAMRNGLNLSNNLNKEGD